MVVSRDSKEVSLRDQVRSVITKMVMLLFSAYTASLPLLTLTDLRNNMYDFMPNLMSLVHRANLSYLTLDNLVNRTYFLSDSDRMFFVSPTTPSSGIKCWKMLADFLVT